MIHREMFHARLSCLVLRVTQTLTTIRTSEGSVEIAPVISIEILFIGFLFPLEKDNSTLFNAS